MEGYIYLYKKITETSFYKDSHAVHLAIHLLLKANYTDKKIIFNGQEITIKRGEHLTGTHALAMETGMTRSMVMRKLEILKNVGFSDIKSNNRFSIITICKYNDFQIIKYNVGQQIGQPADNQRTTSGQPADTPNKEVLKELKELNTSCPNSSYPDDSDEVRLAEVLLSLIQSRNKDFKKPNIQSWAKDINSIFRIDNRPIDEAERIIRWCQSDNFWQNNILSPAKLRKQYDQLKMKMNKGGASGEGTREEDGQKIIDEMRRICEEAT